METYCFLWSKKWCFSGIYMDFVIEGVKIDDRWGEVRQAAVCKQQSAIKANNQPVFYVYFSRKSVKIVCSNNRAPLISK
jgi:hypothetical protein